MSDRTQRMGEIIHWESEGHSPRPPTPNKTSGRIGPVRIDGPDQSGRMPPGFETVTLACHPLLVNRRSFRAGVEGSAGRRAARRRPLEAAWKELAAHGVVAAWTGSSRQPPTATTVAPVRHLEK
jgi:hypothetical protein